MTTTTPKDDLPEALTAMCSHGLDARCVWCLRSHEPSIAEIIECMDGEFK